MIDIDGIGESLRTRIELDVTDFNRVTYEMDERDDTIMNMPLADVRFVRMDPEVRAGNDYVVEASYIVTVEAFDFTSRREAATLRNGLVKTAMLGVKDNPRFDTDLESSFLGPAEFVDAKDDDTGAFVAMATFQVNVIVFVDAL